MIRILREFSITFWTKKTLFSCISKNLLSQQISNKIIFNFLSSWSQLINVLLFMHILSQKTPIIMSVISWEKSELSSFHHERAFTPRGPSRPGLPYMYLYSTLQREYVESILNFSLSPDLYQVFLALLSRRPGSSLGNRHHLADFYCFTSQVAKAMSDMLHQHNYGHHRSQGGSVQMEHKCPVELQPVESSSVQKAGDKPLQNTTKPL